LENRADNSQKHPSAASKTRITVTARTTKTVTKHPKMTPQQPPTYEHHPAKPSPHQNNRTEKRPHQRKIRRESSIGDNFK
jgi:hypothetical protein